MLDSDPRISLYADASKARSRGVSKCVVDKDEVLHYARANGNIPSMSFIEPYMWLVYAHTDQLVLHTSSHDADVLFRSRPPNIIISSFYLVQITLL